MVINIRIDIKVKGARKGVLRVKGEERREEGKTKRSGKASKKPAVSIRRSFLFHIDFNEIFYVAALIFLLV